MDNEKDLVKHNATNKSYWDKHRSWHDHKYGHTIRKINPRKAKLNECVTNPRTPIISPFCLFWTRPSQKPIMHREFMKKENKLPLIKIIKRKCQGMTFNTLPTTRHSKAKSKP